MAASTLSLEEFQRLQDQLLQLREENYKFKEQCRKQETELNTLRDDVTRYDRDLAKANKAIGKSKKAQEYETLLTESDNLQRKMISQEEDFQLQNNTLMKELSKLYDDNESLKKQLEEVKGQQRRPSTGEENGQQAELRRLQAANAALQKNLASLQEKNEAEAAKPTSNLEGALTEHGDTNEVEVSSEGRVQSLSTADKELQLQIDTEREENKLLKHQLSSSEIKSKTEINKLGEEVSKLTEKLKKKQESLVQLQNEKEQLYNHSKTSLEELKIKKDREMHGYVQHNKQLQEELVSTNKSVLEMREHSQHTVNYLQQTIDDLKSQVSNHSAISNEQLEALNTENRSVKAEIESLKQANYLQSEEIARLKNMTATLTSDLEGLQNQHSALTAEKEDVQCQLAECLNANSRLLEQLTTAQQQLATAQQQLEALRKVAENRKSMLDEMAIQVQTTKQQHGQQITLIQENNKSEQDDLRHQLADSQTRVTELQKLRPLLEELEKKAQSLEGAKGWLERRLEEAEANQKLAEKHHEEALEELQEAHQQQLEGLQNELTQQEGVMGHIKEENTRLGRTVEEMKQNFKDELEDRKLGEKKGLSMVKDLKRQLHTERKRAEKLQEKLQELLSDSSKSNIEELLYSNSNEERSRGGDSGSVSSWSDSNSVRKLADQHLLQVNAGATGTDSVSEEMTELIGRIGKLRNENLVLEEKVMYLEENNACMVDDLMKKSAIIEAYVMDGRTDSSPGHGHGQRKGQQPLPLQKKVMNFMSGGGGGQASEDLGEMNRKLQRMLEETLTKNLHLQKDIETMSEEIVRLSKILPAKTDHSGGSS